MAKRITTKITVAFLGMLMVLSLFFDTLMLGRGIAAKADDTVTIRDYGATDIMDDLSDVDVLLYPKNPLGKPAVVRFMEYCYSDKSFFAEYYGLYLYIYNPTEKALKTEAGYNVINMAVEYSSDGEPSAYKNVDLMYCDSTENNRFYKFKVAESAELLSVAKAYASAHGGERRYDIAGIQLTHTDGAFSDDYKQDREYGKTYYFSGYAYGCGDTSESESTLTCRVDDLETLHLDVHPTVYRPEGDNGKNEYTQDSLHSVYFAVPNEMIAKYGEMTAVHATWLNAVLAPALVTGNYDAYNAILAYLGKEISQSSDNEYHTDELPYMYYGALTGAGAGYSNQTCYYGYSYNAKTGWSGHTMIHSETGDVVNPLYALYYAGSGIDSADNYTASSEQILLKLKASAAKYGGELVNDKYSRVMFESVDSEFTEVNIKADETYSLTERKIDKWWWNGLFGEREDVVKTTVFDDIAAIYAVKESDLTGTSEEVAKRLYISEGDYDTFLSYYNKNKSDSTVYLFRYQTSDYISQEATLYHYIENGNIVTGRGWQEADTNAYFFQETVNLDFEVIDVTFTKEGTDTVIPVVSNPIDIIPDATPPLNTQTDEDPWEKLFGILIGGVGLIVIVIILLNFAPGILKFLFDVIVWLFSLLLTPFKWIFNGLRALFGKDTK